MAKAKTVNPQSIFDHFGLDESGRPKPKVAPQGNEDREKALLDQIAGLNSRVEELSNAMIREPRQVVVHPQPVRTQEEPLIDVSGLPDPIEKPAEFNKALSERISGAISKGVTRQMEQFNASRAEADDTSAKAEALWEGFSAKFPEFEDYQEQVEFVATKLVEKKAKTGADVQRYVFGTQDKFFDDVAAEVRKFVPKAEDENDRDGSEEGEEEPVFQGRTPYDTDDGRTAGIFGGQTSGGKPAKGKATEEAPADFIADLQNIQKATGFM